MSAVIDITAALETLKNELRDEILAELRADHQPDPWPRWMSVDTAARYLDSSTERIRKLVRRGCIPYVQEGPGCRVFFDREAIDNWMNGKPPAATPEAFGPGLRDVTETPRARADER